MKYSIEWPEGLTDRQKEMIRKAIEASSADTLFRIGVPHRDRCFATATEWFSSGRRRPEVECVEVGFEFFSDGTVLVEVLNED